MPRSAGKADRGIPAGDAIRFHLRYSEIAPASAIGKKATQGNNMKNKAVKIGIIASILPHLFCCVLPIVLSVVSLFVPEVAHSSFFMPEWLEPWLFVFSALMLGLSWLLVIRDCPCKCGACHDESGHKPQKIILIVVTVLFIASIALHIVAHH